MMATASSPHSSNLHNGLAGYYSTNPTTPVSANRVIKKQRHPPLRLPPPPPTAQSHEDSELESPAAPLQVGPVDLEADELGPLKQLIVSPHLVHSDSQEHFTPSIHQLNITADDTPPSTATSPSPQPLPEPNFSYSTSAGLSRYSPMDNLAVSESDSEDEQWPTTLPLARTVSDAVQTPEAVRKEDGYIRVTREQLSRGGVYGGMEEEGTMMSSVPMATLSSHRPITRQHLSLASSRSVVSSSLPLREERTELLLSPDQEPQFLGRTRPVPPPRHQTTSPPPHISTPHDKTLHLTVSSPALFSTELTRSRSVSFLQCKAGNDLGSFPADYLGSKEIDCYTHCVNTVAKQLVDSKPVEVITYVSSEKIRLAPPRNAALLFKSFAVRDILKVEMCSKNKRIVGIVVWKRGLMPVCHVLRCHTSLVSTGLYESLLYQTQQVDEVSQDKSQPPALDSLDETTPDSAQDSTSLLRDSPSTNHTHQQPPAPTDLLHKLPAIYVGGASAGKLHSVSEVIDKVLTERKPSQSREVEVWLSLSQVKLVQTSEGGKEEVCVAHETSRIRAIGVCNIDKRYMGYIIKEEGKPLAGHVIRCTSAALMVSLMSFLRQSCQLMVFQRGGSFYDELSADEGDFDTSQEGPIESSKIVKRIRSLTMSLSNRHAVSPTRPSFQSHTFLRKQLSPAQDMPPKMRDAVQNPLLVSPANFTEYDYARFTVTYVGSASLYIPYTRESVLDALQAFEEGGVASGQAAITKNSIDMQVSALNVSLTDKTHKLFVTRNYPRKQIQGFSLHPKDPKYFGLATTRPGFPANLKVHVFKCGEEPSTQIVDSLKYWLEIEPAT